MYKALDKRRILCYYETPNTQHFIEDCCVCNIKTDTVYTLEFLEIFGMAKEYVQKINICPKCGFIYTKNPFQEEILANRYKNLSKFEFDENFTFIEEDISYKKRCYRQYNFIKNVVGNIESIFEVGCASGFNLSIYHNNGINVFGIEPSKNNVISCQRKYGIELFEGMFDEYKRSSVSNKQYELIFLSHVLEHIINPFKFVSELSEINSRFMFIEVPSLDYKFYDEPFGMFAEEHVNYFTFDNLRQLMKSLKYHIIDANIYFCSDADIPAGYPCISTLWEKTNIQKNYSLTSAMPSVMSSKELLMNYINKSLEREKQINEIINRINNKERIAVWGTGHHTSRLLGMTNLKTKNIVKFYDSDIRKSNMEYFGRRIQPFDISDIKKNNIEKVFISTYVAQKAIEKILIKNDMNNYIKLY